MRRTQQYEIKYLKMYVFDTEEQKTYDEERTIKIPLSMLSLLRMAVQDELEYIKKDKFDTYIDDWKTYDETLEALRYFIEVTKDAH